MNTIQCLEFFRGVSVIVAFFSLFGIIAVKLLIVYVSKIGFLAVVTSGAYPIQVENRIKTVKEDVTLEMRQIK